MKKILLLKADNSLGKKTIEVISEHKDELELVGVGVFNDVDYLEELLNEYQPDFAFSFVKQDDLILKHRNIRFYFGSKGLAEIAKEKDYDILIDTLNDISSLKPTLIAINNKKDILSANKENLVVGGDIIRKAVFDSGIKYMPIDIELLNIYDCLKEQKNIRRLYITSKIYEVDEDVKSNINNITMMELGYEIIAAHYLFDLPYTSIEPIIHPDLIVQSIVENEDGTIITKISSLDEKMAIIRSLLEFDNKDDDINLNKKLNLSFETFDYGRFPLVKLAKSIGNFGGNFGAILAGAYDETIDLYLNGRIDFIEIEEFIFKALKQAHYVKNSGIEELLEYNKWARDFVRNSWANNK